MSDKLEAQLKECREHLAVVEKELREASLTEFQRLSRDIREAARTLEKREARYLVDLYYNMQDYRISTDNQARSMGKDHEPHMSIDFFRHQMSALEEQVKKVLDDWTSTDPTGIWAKNQIGIGPVISAGLLAHIDFEKAKNPSKIWRYAGLDPTLKWLGTAGAKTLLGHVYGDSRDPDYEAMNIDPSVLSEEEIQILDENLREDGRGQLSREQLVLVSRLSNRSIGMLVRAAKDDKGRITRTSMLRLLAKRPWNASLKVVCWKAGESFVKFSNHERCLYGHLYQERKELEVTRNEAGDFQAQAAQALKNKNYRKDTDAYKAYSEGMLPPAHVHARAKRFAVKIFLVHFWETGYRNHYGKEPPEPYAFTPQGGHSDRIPAPE